MEKIEELDPYQSIVGKGFKIVHKIFYQGGVAVFHAIHLRTNMEVALKVEGPRCKHSMIKGESEVYTHLLKGLQGINAGIPNIYFPNLLSRKVMAMDLLGPSLESLFESSMKRFSLKTVLMLLDSMLRLAEFVHNRGYIHRYLKPDCFCIGRGKSAHKLFLIDFGTA